jgi:hypothetical protein
MTAILPYLRDAVFEQKDITAMSMALDDVCKTLNISDGNPAGEVLRAHHHTRGDWRAQPHFLTTPQGTPGSSGKWVSTMLTARPMGTGRNVTLAGPVCDGVGRRSGAPTGERGSAMQKNFGVVEPSRRPILHRVGIPILRIFMVVVEIAWVTFLGYGIAWLLH